jgi:RES domain-containing protein
MKESSVRSQAVRPENLWRISNHKDLAGLGGEKAEGRWHTAARGKRIVYLAEHPAVALIETLANLEGDPELFPDFFQMIKAEVNDEASIEVLDPHKLSRDWENNIKATQSIGDKWLAEGRSTLLVVPSVPSPESVNYLYNPLHEGAGGVVRVWSKKLSYDKRLFHIR